ncbi:hypothetical protein FRX31_011580 [Thalictrum thalictroides]|uniref:Uncharacterized protein n=1 Tax=Thalictrum thalictroides TaxID=46969 RepID=A0A7J6WRT8_THATH|nr:hypothetical protein FRX31_011580 [Thalictrum thalictroides]
MRKGPAAAKMVMCLWFCLEELGYHCLIENICSCDDIMIAIVFEEALSCLKCIGPNPTVPGDWEDDLVVSTLVEESIKRRFVYFNRELIYDRMNHFLNTICNVIFDDNPAMGITSLATPRAQPETSMGVDSLATSRAQAETSLGVASRVVPRAHVETSMGVDIDRASSRDQAAETCMGVSDRASFRAQAESSMQGSLRASRPSSSLDPHASPFYVNELPPRDQRTMFITYSHGYPIPNEEVMEFFRKGWGDVVEDIVIDHKDGIINPEPEYARLVFKNVLTIHLILSGQEKVKFNIKGRQLWARLFVPRKKRNSQQSKGKSN